MCWKFDDIVSTTYLKLGDLVDTYSKINDTVFIHHVFKNKGVWWVSTAHRNFEADNIKIIVTCIAMVVADTCWLVSI